MRDIPSSVERIGWIIDNIEHPDVKVRREAAGGAQYALLGDLPRDKTEILLEKLAGRLELKLNGHAEPVEPDEYVRERCANAFEMAASAFKDVSKYVHVLKLSAARDPHDWVKDMARDALRYCRGNSSDLPAPKGFTTRPSHEARREPGQKYLSA